LKYPDHLTGWLRSQPDPNHHHTGYPGKSREKAEVNHRVLPGNYRYWNRNRLLGHVAGCSGRFQLLRFQFLDTL